MLIGLEDSEFTHVDSWEEDSHIISKMILKGKPILVQTLEEETKRSVT